MSFPKVSTSRPYEVYKPLAFMFIGATFWVDGSRLGIFADIGRYASLHGFIDPVILSSLMGLGALTSLARTSDRLRRALAALALAEAAAETSGRHDLLTGLANRRYFHERFDEALARSDSGPHALIMIDLDKFKPVNDAHGHIAGNAVLCAIADRLRALAPEGSTVARLGGDEFAMLIPFRGDRRFLVGLAQRILAAARRPIPWHNGEVGVDCTIGVAVATSGEADFEALLHAADIAMYQGKRQGRGTFRFFRPEMELAIKTRALIEKDLRTAIVSEEIVPFYQPIVSLPKKDLVGFEVLARWQRADGDQIAPDLFIPVAEEAGMIGDLFFCILRQACTDAMSWPSDLFLSVNISQAQLHDVLLPVKMLEILTETGFPAHRLEAEITETAVVNDLRSARAALLSLHNLGVKIALDDFGTGYSSLYHLRELRFDKLKIDRSFVTTLQQGSDDAKMVDAIIHLGASLSLETIAEGIETDANVDWLAGQGCNFGQGYLFGRPMDKGEAGRHANRVKADAAVA